MSSYFSKLIPVLPPAKSSLQKWIKQHLHSGPRTNIPAIHFKPNYRTCRRCAIWIGMHSPMHVPSQHSKTNENRIGSYNHSTLNTMKILMIVCACHKLSNKFQSVLSHEVSVHFGEYKYMSFVSTTLHLNCTTLVKYNWLKEFSLPKDLKATCSFLYHQETCSTLRVHWVSTYFSRRSLRANGLDQSSSSLESSCHRLLPPPPNPPRSYLPKNTTLKLETSASHFTD